MLLLKEDLFSYIYITPCHGLYTKAENKLKFACDCFRP